jgi:hypothetical protein
MIWILDMKQLIVSLVLQCALLSASRACMALEDVDLDDITMTVVGDGMFEARQLQRPNLEAIREFMRAEPQVGDAALSLSTSESPRELQTGDAIPIEPIERAALASSRGSRPESRPSRPVFARPGQ